MKRITREEKAEEKVENPDNKVTIVTLKSSPSTPNPNPNPNPNPLLRLGGGIRGNVLTLTLSLREHGFQVRGFCG
jgi:hypothetical protein